MTLTSDLVFRTILSGTYLSDYLRWESQIRCVDALWMVECCVPFTVTVALNLTSDLVLEKFCLEHISYIIQGRNPKFHLLMHLGLVDCPVPFSCHLTSDLVSRIGIESGA